MERRFNQLDSIRGLASITVLLAHIVATMPYISFIISKYSPFKVLVNGHAAVIMFFILSGFVLSLPYLKGKSPPYSAFIIKRIFRIYVPYIVSIGVSITLCTLLSKGGIPELNEWFNMSWQAPLDAKTIVMHLVLIGNFNTDVYNNVIWSLIHEMRISIIFPILAILVIKLSWKYVIGVCVTVSLVSGLNYVFGIEESYGFHTSFLDTTHYISMFLFGGLLAKKRTDLISIYLRLPKMMKWFLFVVAFILYNYSGVVKNIANKIGLNVYADISSDYCITIGSILFIAIALGSKKIAQLLANKIIMYLGDISYSLYLYHLIILLGLIYTLYGVASLELIYLLTILGSVAVGTLSYYFIEIPAINVGKRLSNNRLARKSMAKSNSRQKNREEGQNWRKNLKDFIKQF